jgi:hypothetical protein
MTKDEFGVSSVEIPFEPERATKAERDKSMIAAANQLQPGDIVIGSDDFRKRRIAAVMPAAAAGRVFIKFENGAASNVSEDTAFNILRDAPEELVVQIIVETPRGTGQLLGYCGTELSILTPSGVVVAHLDACTVLDGNLRLRRLMARSAAWGAQRNLSGSGR